MFKRIVALALNPSLDTTLWLDDLNLSHEALWADLTARGATPNIGSVQT